MILPSASQLGVSEVFVCFETISGCSSMAPPTLSGLREVVAALLLRSMWRTQESSSVAVPERQQIAAYPGLCVVFAWPVISTTHRVWVVLRHPRWFSPENSEKKNTHMHPFTSPYSCSSLKGSEIGSCIRFAVRTCCWAPISRTCHNSYVICG